MALIINNRPAVHVGSNHTLVTQDLCLDANGNAIPFQNVAKSADAAQTDNSVLVDNRPICTKNSIFATSRGDEAGINKGIKSGTIQGKAEFITASSNVFINNIAAVRRGDLMVSNNHNTPPEQLL